MPDNIVLTFHWSGTAQGELVSLSDNGLAIIPPSSTVIGNGMISLSYTVARTVQHLVQWGVVFPSGGALNLVASATRNGQAAQVLDNNAGPSALWNSQGVVL